MMRTRPGWLLAACASLTLVLTVASCTDDEGAGPAPSEDAGPPDARRGDAGAADVGRDLGPPLDTGPPWTGSLRVRVVDREGAPVPLATVNLGGQSEVDWVLSDEAGLATVPIVAMPDSERWVTAGKVGWLSWGDRVPEEDPGEEIFEIALPRLPAEDNPDYEVQEGGSMENMGSTAQCAHCHITIVDEWNRSAHHEAIANPRMRDLFNGSALLASEEQCAALGGRWAESAVPGGDGALQVHCFTGRGVLPDLNDGCGGVDQLPCDHPAVDRSAFEGLGHCGDCHGPAIKGAVGGRVDLNASRGFVHNEGVACDLCHKIAAVTPGGAPGISGSVRLLRPSVPSTLPLLEFEPIQFGPYPDTINPFMGGSFQPQFRQSSFCAGCHEMAQPALDPADAERIDPERWPGGLPIFTTFSEWEAWPHAPSMTCQGCHMPVLEEESSTFDITPQGFRGSIALGWIRPTGEVHSHSWPSVAELGPAAVTLAVALDEEAGEVVASVTARNVGAGHALPTGEPLRQLAVLVEATAGDAPVAAIGGRAIDVAGGALAHGAIGEGVVVEGRQATFSGPIAGAEAALVLRFTRPTGAWADFEGPGVGWFSEPGRTAEEKGLPIHDLVGEVAVASVTPSEDGASVVVTLAADPPAIEPGDVAYLVAEGQWAGAAGWLHAKVLADREGRSGVHHYQAVDIVRDNRLAAGGQSTTTHRFPAPGPGSPPLRVEARLVYRALADSVARRYAWPRRDLELARAAAAE